ncbi:MAG: NAD(P)-dependent alcohol dehydrogenase [Anaerolineales bacterium]
MKAIIHHKYGLNGLKLEDVEKPIPAADEVLVRVRASSVNPAEWYAAMSAVIMRPMMGMVKPKNPRIGTDFAGVVEAVGAAVKDFRPGDEVYGGRTGAYADYVSVRKAISPKSVNLTFEQAAALPTAAITALQGLRDHGKLQPGQKVLINGASGGVGTFAIQIANLGAEVTAVCSTDKVEIAHSLGADRVVDYTKEDFTRIGERYDLFLDIAGGRTWSACRRVLKPDSIFVIVGAQKKNRILGPLGGIVRLRLGALRASQKIVFFIASFNREDFATLTELVEAGKVTPVIDRTYPLDQIRDAMRYLGQGHAKGKIIVTVP